MVKQGAAWVYRQYAQDAGLYRLEDEAKAARRGLWRLARSGTLPALGLAEAVVPDASGGAGFTGHPCAGSGHQRRLLVRRQAVLSPTDLV